MVKPAGAAVAKKKIVKPPVEDDLDDLDDLMGGAEPAAAGGGLDDDDFFGEKQQDDYDMPRKKKGGEDDPLDFLAKAQQEKANAAQRKAEMAANANAKWKKIEELDYNLISKFMDSEDKWRQTLGQDLYKDRANALSVDPTMRQ